MVSSPKLSTTLKEFLPRSHYQHQMALAMSRKARLIQSREEEAQSYLSTSKEVTTITLQDNVNQILQQQLAFGFTHFEGVTFSGITGEPPMEISEVYFFFCTFKNCTFHHVTFRNCIFTGVVFDHVDMTTTYFDNCVFNEQEETASIFTACRILGNYGTKTETFHGCALQAIVFDQTQLTNTIFQNCNLAQCVMDSVTLTAVEFRRGDLTGMSICHPHGLDVQFSGTEDIQIDEDFFMDDSCDQPETHWSTSRTLSKLSRLLEFHGLNGLAGEYNYRSKRLEESVATGAQRIRLAAQRISCGYGERPSFTFLFILAQIVIFSVIYLFSGVADGTLVINYNLIGSLSSGSGNPLHDYLTCLFFSLTTYSTVGYGNYLPSGGISMAMASVQMLSGLGMTALWSGCLLRKLAR